LFNNRCDPSHRDGGGVTFNFLSLGLTRGIKKEACAMTEFFCNILYSGCILFLGTICVYLWGTLIKDEIEEYKKKQKNKK